MRKLWTSGVLLAGVLLGFSATAETLHEEARCDFDGDGFSELAIGVPGDDEGIGAVYIIDYQEDLLLYDTQWFRPGQNVDTFGAINGGHFGAALACGDFNGDGYADLAVGAPGVFNNQGSVSVLYGDSGGLQDPPWDGRLYQNMVGFNESMEDDDYFGAALTAGDFNGDGVDDLAIGVPGETDPGGLFVGLDSQGLVHVLYGRTAAEAGPDGPPGPSPLGSEKYHPNLIEINVIGNAHYGRSLAAADLNGDDVADLAVGAPYAWVDVSGNPNTPNFKKRAGVVHVLLGADAGAVPPDGGLDISTSLILDQLVAPNTPETDELFGYSLAVGNFDGADGFELAVGVPLEKLGEHFPEVGHGYGAVNVFGFTPGGDIDQTSFWFDSLLLGDGEESRDFWGFALAAGDFDHNGEDDLAIGRMGENLEEHGGIVSTGAVTVLYGSAGGLLDAANDQRTISRFVAPDHYQEFGFALTTGKLIDPDEVNLVVGVPGWVGENSKEEPVKNAGAVAIFRSIDGDGVAEGSLNGWLHKAMIEENELRLPENTLDKLVLPADTLVEGFWRGERFGAALAH